MEKKSIFIIIVRAILAIFIIVLLPFIYTYLTALNPIVYFNVIIWYFFAALLILPSSFISDDEKYQIPLNFLISMVTIFLVYGMKSSIFMTTAMSAFLDNGSMWLPKVDFEDMFKTLISFEEYKSKLGFLTEFDTLNLSFKGRKGIDTGTWFTNFFRIIECLGIFIIPIYVTLKNKKDQ
jgi:hypothetical protein